MERKTHEVIEFNGRLVYMTDDVREQIRIRRESQTNPMVQRYWAAHNQVIRKRTGDAGLRSHER